jgi:drug/metabolite transporter (DMT)-like permease
MRRRGGSEADPDHRSLSQAWSLVMSTSSFARADILRLTLAAACWGIGTVVSKRAVAEIPPLALLPIQLTASLAVLAVLMRRRGMRLRGASGAPLLGRLGILNPGLAYALSLLGLVSISASLSVLIWAFEPLMIMALAALVLRERIGPAVIILSLVAIGGIVVVLYSPTSGGQWPGVALTIAGVGCCAIYTVVARRLIGTSDSTAQVVAAQQAYALMFALVLVVAGSIVLGAPRLGAATPAAWLSAVGSGILYYAAAYWFYLNGLRGVPASLAAVSFFLIPIFGLAGSFVFLGERLGIGQWVGVAVVLAAVVAIAGGRFQSGPGEARPAGAGIRRPSPAPPTRTPRLPRELPRSRDGS